MSEVIQEYDGTLGRVLHQMNGAGAGGQLFHGDWESNPDVLNTFASNATRKAWMARQELETPTTRELDLQPWTHIADYSVHPDSPLTRIKGALKICARITANNRIQFGVFREVPADKRMKKHQTLARITAGNGLEQLRHGTQNYVMRIAGKGEAEARMLDGGKLRKCVNPKFAGLLMDCGHAKVRIKGTFKNSTGSRDYGPYDSMMPYFGHIWSYWYVIEGNVLYFTGLPLYTDNRKGTIVHTYSGTLGDDGEWRYSSKRTTVDLPPTLDDLKSGGFSSARVRDAGFTSAPNATFRNLCADIWGLGNNQFGLAGEEVRLVHLLDKLLSRNIAKRVILQRTLARITQNTNGTFSIRQIGHGDAYAPLTALGFNGGVYGGAVAGRDDVSYVTSLPGHGGPASSGTSGYIPSRSRFSLANRAVDSAQAFRVARYGCGYYIETKGAFRPYANYHDEEDLPAYDVSLTCNLSAQGDYPPPPWPDPDPMPDPDDDDDDDDRRPEDLGDLGYWYEHGADIQVTHKRDKSDLGTLRYIHTITVTANVTASRKLVYNITAEFSVADGNSFEVVGNRVAMWYGLAYSPGILTVTNLTSMRWQGDGSWTPNTHPDAAVAATLSVWRKAHASADFDPLAVTSEIKLPSGNIVSITPTGRTKRVHGLVQASPKAKKRHAHGTMEILKVSLNKAVVEQILKNHLLLHAPDVPCTVTPPQVRGDVHGALAGAPVVRAGGAVAQCVSAKVAKGAVHPTGPITMCVSGAYDSVSAKYDVEGGFSDWYEVTPSNRKSCTISGQFTASADTSISNMESP